MAGRNVACASCDRRMARKDGAGDRARHLAAVENDTLRLDNAGTGSGARFRLLLFGIERLTLLTSNNAEPRATQACLSGSCAPALPEPMTDAERENMFWELA